MAKAPVRPRAETKKASMPRADRIRAATVRADSSTTDSTLTFEVKAEGIESPTKASQVR